MNKQLTTEITTHVIVLKDGGFVGINEKQANIVIEKIGGGSQASHLRINNQLIATSSINRVTSYSDYEESQLRAGKVKCGRGHWHWADDKDLCPAERQTSNELWDSVVSAFSSPEKAENVIPVNFKEKSPILAKAYIEGRNDFRKMQGKPPVTVAEVPSWARKYV